MAKQILMENFGLGLWITLKKYSKWIPLSLDKKFNLKKVDDNYMITNGPAFIDKKTFTILTVEKGNLQN